MPEPDEIALERARKIEHCYEVEVRLRHQRNYDAEEDLRERPPTRVPATSSVESVRLDPELNRKLLRRAAQEDISVAEVIGHAIDEYLRL